MATNEDLAADLGEVKGKLDTLLKFYEEDRKRLGAVETKVWALPAVGAVFAVAVNAAMTKLGIPKL